MFFKHRDMELVTFKSGVIIRILTLNHNLNEEDQLSSKRTKFESTMIDNLELLEISMLAFT